MNLVESNLSRVDLPQVAEQPADPIHNHNWQYGAVEVHIEKLVLDGLAAKDGALIQAAIERELARLLLSRGLSPLMRHEANSVQLEAGRSSHAPGLSNETLGIQVAQGILRGMKQ